MLKQSAQVRVLEFETVLAGRLFHALVPPRKSAAAPPLLLRGSQSPRMLLNVLAESGIRIRCSGRQR